MGLVLPWLELKRSRRQARKPFRCRVLQVQNLKKCGFRERGRDNDHCLGLAVVKIASGSLRSQISRGL